MPATRRGAVLGHPIGHSKSPALHNAAYAALGIDFSYQAFDLQVPDLAPFLERIREEGNWYGLSVTMPLKNEAVRLADQLSPAAQILGAANTLTISTNGQGQSVIRGDNTDVAGIVNALRHAGVRNQPRAAILGGGGTAVAAVAALKQLNAPSVDLYLRDTAKAGSTVAVAAGLGLAHQVLDYEGARGTLGTYDVVISTLPPRAADPLATDLDGRLPDVSGACLLDVAYDPWPSALATAWSRQGGTVVPGIEMLLYQGLEQVKLFVASGGENVQWEEEEGPILTVMCDALGLMRRPPLGHRH